LLVALGSESSAEAEEERLGAMLRAQGFLPRWTATAEAPEEVGDGESPATQELPLHDA
jgi:hypothetical protein